MLFLHFIFVLILLEAKDHFESENGKTPEAGPCPWCTERDQSHQLPLIQSAGFLRGSLPCTVFCTCFCLLLLSILQLLKTVNQQWPLSSRHMGAFQQNLCKSHCEMKDASHREVPCLSEPSMYTCMQRIAEAFQSIGRLFLPIRTNWVSTDISISFLEEEWATEF